MRPVLTKIMAAALTVSVSMGMGAAPGFAESSGGMAPTHFPQAYSGGGHHAYRHYRHHHRSYRHHHRRHYRHGGYYHRHHNNGAGVAAGLITGAIIGGIAANAMSNRGGGNAHVRWCYDHYRSYRASDNTYQPYHGPRRQCVSPY